MKLTPVLNDCIQTIYGAYAEAEKRKEEILVHPHFILHGNLPPYLLKSVCILV